MSYRLRQEGHDPKVLVFDRSTILNEVGEAARRKLSVELAGLGIEVRENATVENVAGDGQLPTDFVVGAAGAYPFPWVSELGLAMTNGKDRIDRKFMAQLEDQR